MKRTGSAQRIFVLETRTGLFNDEFNNECILE